MNTKEAYKIGFMLKCAELGVDPEKAARDLVTMGYYKSGSLGGWGQALTNFFKGTASLAGGVAQGVGSAAGGAFKGVGKVLSPAMKLALISALLVPPMAGAYAGYNLADVTDPPLDIDELKKQEELAEYEKGISTLRRSLISRGVKV